MNERIKELWSQAGGHYNSGNQHTWPEYTIDDPEKFAELIRAEHTRSVIQLCAKTINDNLNAEKQRRSNRWDNVNLVLIIIGMIAWVTFWYTQFHMI
jgi:hypothetical protein